MSRLRKRQIKPKPGIINSTNPPKRPSHENNKSKSPEEATDAPDTETVQTIKKTETLEAHKNWLLLCSDPWDEVRTKWQLTWPLRLTEIKCEDSTLEKIFQEWPAFLSKKGYELVMRHLFIACIHIQK